MSAKYLTYYDADVDLEDVELFEDGRWLNDKCIDLFIEYLDHNLTSKDDISRSKVFLLRAALTYLISNIQDSTFLAGALPKRIFTAQVIFMIVNDNVDVTKARGGNHWSLLIFIRKTNKFLHYDSANGMNIGVAKYNAMRIASVLNVTGSSFHNMKTPLQENEFDLAFEIEQDQIPIGREMRKRCKKIVQELREAYVQK
ncbi:3977_t:CDS:2 [Gigaspora rosea]|nr:3977_t:CDS:2 [Gigaspora rosea]